MPIIHHVAIHLPVPTLFDYLTSNNCTIAKGSRVSVPFGKGFRTGLVIDHTSAKNTATRKLKYIDKALDNEPLLNQELLDNLAWASQYWLGTPGEVFMGALPLSLRQGKECPETGMETWQLTELGQTELANGKRRGQSLALMQLLANQEATASTLDSQLPGWRNAARRLAKTHIVTPYFNQTLPTRTTTQHAPPLTREQGDACQAIRAAPRGFQTFLLEGITGSGKTEVYMAIMQDMLANDRQTLMLVPEISLTPQAITRLRERLGAHIEVIHSGLSKGERARAWLRAAKGQAKIIVGTRSAIFTPLKYPGLIVIDEEHDGSYKQQDGFRYHARDLALMRAKKLAIPIILGSATPSLESLNNAHNGRFIHLRLRQRAQQQNLPDIKLLDVRSQTMNDGLSTQLLNAIDAALKRNEQVLVFRNRRGYAPVLMCHACGWHSACPRCDRPMTLHAGQHKLICHHCGHTGQPPSCCPQCGHAELKPQGFGTERIDTALRQRFQDVPIKRIDSETMYKRDAFNDLFADLAKHQAAILVGTQILAKGHDLPNLTLVAITGVDEGLLSLDFRSQEYLAQLLTQVAGRAGRAQKKGRVILQTLHPEHPFLHLLLAKGYHASAMELLAERRSLHLPPYSHQALLHAEAMDQNALGDFLNAARTTIGHPDNIRIYGPMPAPMPKRAGKHRGQILLEADQRSCLHHRLKPWYFALFKLKQARKVRWSINVDPTNLYG